MANASRIKNRDLHSLSIVRVPNPAGGIYENDSGLRVGLFGQSRNRAFGNLGRRLMLERQYGLAAKSHPQYRLTGAGGGSAAACVAKETRPDNR